MPETLQTIVVLQALAWVIGVVGAFLYGRHYQRRVSSGMTKDQIITSDKATLKDLVANRVKELEDELNQLRGK